MTNNSARFTMKTPKEKKSKKKMPKNRMSKVRDLAIRGEQNDALTLILLV